MNSPELIPAFLKIVSALVLTVGIMILVAYLFKKIVKRTGAVIGNDDLIQVLSVKYLGSKNSIMLVNVLDNIMAIGISNGGISMLTEIVDIESLEKLKHIQGKKDQRKSFPDHLKALLKSNGSRLDTKN